MEEWRLALSGARVEIVKEEDAPQFLDRFADLVERYSN